MVAVLLRTVPQAATAPQGGTAPDPLASRLKALRDIASLVNAGSDLRTILQRIAAAVCQHTAWTMGGLMKVDLETGFSELVAQHDPYPRQSGDMPTRWSLATSPALRVAGTGTPIIIADAQTSEEFPGYRDDAISRSYHTAVILPIDATDAQGNRIVLSVQSRDVVSVSEMELAFLSTAAHLGAIAVEKAKRLEAERAQSDRLRRMLAVNENLLASAFAGDSLASLLGTVAAILPEPLVLLDLTTRDVFAHRSPAADVLTEQQWQRFIRRKSAPLLADLALGAQAEGFAVPTVIDFAPAGLALQLPAYVEPLEVDGARAGALFLFQPTNGPKPDTLLAREVTLAINVHLLRSYVRAQGRSESVGELIGALVGGAPLGADAVAARAERLGMDVARPATILALGWPDKAARCLAQLSQALGVVAARQWPGALAALHDNAVAVLLPHAAEPTERARVNRIRLLARRLVQEFTAGGAGPTVAIGSICYRLADYPPVWHRCLRLLRLGQTFGRHGVLDPDAFGPFADLLSAIDATAVEAFVGRTLGAVMSYDVRHKTTLVDTVACFIEQGARYQACATALGIHVSTLRYRIERFQELAGTDLAQTDARFALALALRLRDMARAAPGP